MVFQMRIQVLLFSNWAGWVGSQFSQTHGVPGTARLDQMPPKEQHFNKGVRGVTTLLVTRKGREYMEKLQYI